MDNLNIKSGLNTPVLMKGRMSEKSNAVQSQNFTSNTSSDNQELVKPSVENLKANFLCFTGGKYGKDDDNLNCKVINNTGVKLDDVEDLDQAKYIIKNRVLEFIKNHEIFKSFGISNPSLLIYGPPASGKTFLSKAIAGEAKVPFIPISISELPNQYGDQSALGVKKAFNTARKEAEMHPNKTAIVFIDEFENYSEDKHFSENNETRKQLLEEIDRAAKDKDLNIIVVATANRQLDNLDKDASSKFDTKIELPARNK